MMINYKRVKHFDADMCYCSLYLLSKHLICDICMLRCIQVCMQIGMKAELQLWVIFLLIPVI